MKHLKTLSEYLGIDFIPYVFGKPFKKEIKPEKFNEIKEKLSNFTEKKANEAIQYSKEIYDSENKRLEVIEDKAQNLLAVTGIATAFVIGVADILSHSNSPTDQIIFSILYFLIASSLIITILSSFRVIKVGEYKIASLDINDVFNLNTTTLLIHKIDLLSSYIYSSKNNEQINDKKAIFLIGAQKWFRNSIILFLFLSIFLITTNFQNMNSYNHEGSNNVNPSLSLITESITLAPSITTKPKITENQIKNTQTVIITKSPTKINGYQINETPTPNK